MQRYLARRFALFLPTLLLASIIVFLVMRVMPGDVALLILGGGGEGGGIYQEEALKQLRATLGLNDPLVVQYGKWLWSMVNGTFGGKSLIDERLVRSIIAERFPVTILLALYSIAVAVVVSVPLGIVSALKQDKWPDYVVRIATVAGLALPTFWIGLLIIVGLVIFFKWVPPIIYYHPWENPWEHLQLMIWPTLVLAWHLSSYIARMTRSSLLEVLRQDYIRTAHSKGLSQQLVIYRHALRNALIPVVTVAGLYLGVLLGGTVIMETIFSLPGIGSEMVKSVSTRNYPVTQTLAMIFIFTMLSVNLLVDISYAYIDPRIKYS